MDFKYYFVFLLLLHYSSALTPSDIDAVTSLCQTLVRDALSDAGIDRRVEQMAVAHDNTQRQLADADIDRRIEQMAVAHDNTQRQLADADIDRRIEQMAVAHDNTQRQLADALEKLADAESEVRSLKATLHGFGEKNSADQNTVGIKNKRILLDSSGSTGSDQVAFHADLSYDLHQLSPQQTIAFDQVITNEGHGYNATSGVFHCPVSGLYVFQAAVFAAFNDHIELEMVQDGQPIVNMYAAGSSAASHGYDQGFNSMVVRCLVGQKVWVRVHDSKGMTVASYKMTTFSGYMFYKYGWV